MPVSRGSARRSRRLIYMAGILVDLGREPAIFPRLKQASASLYNSIKQCALKKILLTTLITIQWRIQGVAMGLQHQGRPEQKRRLEQSWFAGP
ncbi:hypothetical protein AVEN_5255-1 [Araneus ventricosus]|uniref:Uncharacterized protein n=1 Tax=Araneus ventricosus TaxID=182803 RepID=A0A4Y2UDH7_ARAVE|nr:hypothetical protein AVEN_5255-1 [Araneus ventricosus]